MIIIPNLEAKHFGNHFIWKPELEFRERYERRTDNDFNAAANDNKSYVYSRYRPGVTWTYGKEWSGELQYQYAHQMTWSQTKNSSAENSDLFQAYVTKSAGNSKISFGRQKLNFGTSRLVASPDWGNTGRSYDAIRYQTKKLDIFAAKIGVMPNRSNQARIAGIGIQSGFGATNFIYKHDYSSSGDIDHYSLDQTYSKEVGLGKLDAEGVVQEGRANGTKQEAWALHLNLKRKLSGKTSGYIEVNSASGGSSASVTRTFDILYPSTHALYGEEDVQGWKNLNQISIGVNHDFSKSFSLGFRANSNDLRDPSDGWYNASGTINKSGNITLRDATGLSGRHIGEEYDLELNYKPAFKGTFSGGLAVFAPGTFVKTLVGSSRNQYWGFLQYSVKF